MKEPEPRPALNKKSRRGGGGGTATATSGEVKGRKAVRLCAGALLRKADLVVRQEGLDQHDPCVLLLEP